MSTTLTQEQFIARATKVHADTYTYDSVVYGKDNTEKVIITCKEHGDFLQSPDKHLRGRGCPSCAITKISLARRLSPNGWSHTEWETKGNASSNFEGFSLYIIHCTGNGEEFVKVGKTFTSIGRRFRSEQALPYKFRVLEQVYYNAYAISKLEEKMHKALKPYSYTPKREFGGQHECYSVEATAEAIAMACK